jgi:hypothetical protein
MAIGLCGQIPFKSPINTFKVLMHGSFNLEWIMDEVYIPPAGDAELGK